MRKFLCVMIKILKIASVVFAMFALSEAVARADVITFNDLPAGYLSSTTTFFDAGYKLVYTPGRGGFAYIGLPSCGPTPCSSNGTNAFYSFNTGTLTISAADGNPISITELDAAQTFTALDRVLDFTVMGLTESASTVTQEFVTAPGAADSFQTFAITTPGFTDLQSVTISGTGSYPTTEFAVDNIVVSGGATVPEPSTWALMLLGFGGLGLSALLRAAKGRRATAAA